MAGVGGPTIEAAKRNLKMSEVRSWVAYRRKRGSLNQSLRIEEGFAYVLATLTSAITKKSVKPADFMPHVVGTQESAEVDSPEQVFNLLKGLATKTDVSNKYLERRRAKHQGNESE